MVTLVGSVIELMGQMQCVEELHFTSCLHHSQACCYTWNQDHWSWALGYCSCPHNLDAFLDLVHSIRGTDFATGCTCFMDIRSNVIDHIPCQLEAFQRQESLNGRIDCVKDGLHNAMDLVLDNLHCPVVGNLYSCHIIPSTSNQGGSLMKERHISSFVRMGFNRTAAFH